MKTEITRLDDCPPRHQHRALNDVLQFAHVARPRVQLQLLQRSTVEALNRLAILSRPLSQEEPRQRRDVFASFAEGTRGPQSLRVMQGLLRLAEKHPAVELEKAASVATHHGTWRLRDLKRLLELPGNVVQLDFLETHPLIRSLDAYRIQSAENLNPNPNP